MLKAAKTGPLKKLLILSAVPLLLIWERLKSIFYNVSVNIHKRKALKHKISKITSKNRNRLIFYIAMLALPVLQFIIFYIFVNINSVLLAFKKMDYFAGGYQFAGFENFAKVLTDIRTLPIFQASIKNSLIVYLFSCGIGTTLSLVFSYYIYKKFLFSGLFKVILFLPQIIPNIVLVIMFKYFAENAIPEFSIIIFNKYIPGLIFNESTKFASVLFYTIWASFGTQILMYSGAMGGISISVIESAKLDGCTPLREFWNIILPLIYPTLVTFIVVGIAGLFTNQMNLFSFFGPDTSPNVYTFGFYLYNKVQSKATTIAEYPYLAAIGLILTLVSAPITLLAKWLLEKIGPSVG
jgi:ABC-type sugar transport system permease subunit